MQSMKTLSSRIKYIRAEMNLSQAAFGREIGVKRSAVHQMETGATQALKGSTIVAIEKVSGFSGRWIESGKGRMRGKLPPLPSGEEEQIDQIYAELLKLPKIHRAKIQAEIEFLKSLNEPEK